MEATVKDINIVQNVIEPTIRIQVEFTHNYTMGIRVLNVTSHLRTTQPMSILELGVPMLTDYQDISHPRGTLAFEVKLGHHGVYMIEQERRKTEDVWLAMWGIILGFALIRFRNIEDGKRIDEGTFVHESFTVSQSPYDKIRISASDWLKWYQQWGKTACSLIIYEPRIAKKLEQIRAELKVADDNELLSRLLSVMESQKLTREGKVVFEFLSTTPEKKSFKAKVAEMLKKAELKDELRVSGYLGTTFQEKFFELVNKGCLVRLVTRKELDKESDTATKELSKRRPDSVRRLNTVHARLFILGDKEAVISSADLKSDSLDTNFEAGIWTNDPQIVNHAVSLFEKMWQAAER